MNCYVEIVPSDTVKYEADEATGYLRIDRPQQYSNVCPSPYGFIPQTICGAKVAERSNARIGRAGLPGDGDPLDICVFTERNIAHGDILLTAIPIGGLRLVDDGQVDDKIVAVLEDDGVFGSLRDAGDCPEALLDRLRHYFLTYKFDPAGGPDGERFIAETYGRDEAHEMIARAHRDYGDKYPLLVRG